MPTAILQTGTTTAIVSTGTTTAIVTSAGAASGSGTTQANAVFTEYAIQGTGFHQPRIRAHGFPIQGSIGAAAASTPAFSPSDIPELAHWYDADDGTTINFSTGSQVDQWDDKEGSDNLVQATSGNQPTLVTNQLNGKDIMRFDGINDFMDVTYTTGLTQPTTIIAVINPNNDTGTVNLWDGIGGSDRHTVFINGSDNYAYFAGSTQNSTTSSDNTFVTLRIVFDGSSSELFRNEVSIDTGNSGSQGMDGLTLGARNDGAQNSQIDVAAFFVFDGTLTAQEISDMDSFINTEYGI
jgi:hypothetical protein